MLDFCAVHDPLVSGRPNMGHPPSGDHPIFRSPWEKSHGRGLLLFLLGVVLPIIVLLFLLWQYVF